MSHTLPKETSPQPENALREARGVPSALAADTYPPEDTPANSGQVHDPAATSSPGCAIPTVGPAEGVPDAPPAQAGETGAVGPSPADTQAGRDSLRDLEEAMQRAREELARLQAAYAHARGAAASEIPHLEQRLDVWLKEGLELVRKYPGRALLAAAACGFILGRILHR
jgi:hypothetical protein